MGGKGQRRREKNYQAAHGDNSRLPPPPNARELDAIPSKLRKIMELKNTFSDKPGTKRALKDVEHEMSKGGAAGKKKANQKDINSSTDLSLKVGDSIKKTTSGKHTQEEDATAHTSSDNGRKRKRKKKEVDLRFQDLGEANAHLRKKGRRKEYLDARKKKHKKAKTDDVVDFPGHEKIKFGEVVEAPPKLSFSKAFKTSLDASRERARLHAIESYRNRRGWVSRPGIQLPTLPETPSS